MTLDRQAELTAIFATGKRGDVVMAGAELITALHKCEKERDEPANAFAIRIRSIFGRKEATGFGEKETKAFKKLKDKISDDDLIMIERYYSANRKKTDNFCRKDIFTFLNNYFGEVDRARTWCEKHPLPSQRKIRTVPKIEQPPEDPEARARFDKDFTAWKAAGRPIGPEAVAKYPALFRNQ